MSGPESLLVERNTFYTGTWDAKVIKVVDGKIVDSIRFTEEKQCGEGQTGLNHVILLKLQPPMTLSQCVDGPWVFADSAGMRSLSQTPTWESIRLISVRP